MDETLFDSLTTFTLLQMGTVASAALGGPVTLRGLAVLERAPERPARATLSASLRTASMASARPVRLARTSARTTRRPAGTAGAVSRASMGKPAAASTMAAPMAACATAPAIRTASTERVRRVPSAPRSAASTPSALSPVRQVERPSASRPAEPCGPWPCPNPLHGTPTYASPSCGPERMPATRGSNPGLRSRAGGRPWMVFASIG